MLQAYFTIVRGSARLWNKEDLKNIMTACIIMHNMIIEDERNDNRNLHELNNYYNNLPKSPPIAKTSHEHSSSILEFFQNHHHIRDRQTHSKLQDLVEYLW